MTVIQSQIIKLIINKKTSDNSITLCHLFINVVWILNNAEWKRLNPDLRVSRVQCGLSNAADMSFNPESSKSLLLRSSSVSLQDWEQTAVDRASQLLPVRLQSLVLEIKNTAHKQKHTQLNLND